MMLVLGLLLAVSGARAQGPQLELLHTVEGDGDHMLYRPEGLCFGPDGACYVLNAGDCRVLQFAADWSVVRAFGRLGEGPGEFTDPTGLVIRDDELWVFQMMRATVFSLDGRYLRTVTSRLEMHEPVVADGGFLVRLGANARLAALLDTELNPIRRLGPECPQNGDFMAEYRACGFVRALPHPDHLALLLNPFDGHLWVLGRDGEVVRELDLMGEAGRSRVNEPNDEGRVVMSFTLVMGAGGVDRNGRYWTVPLPPGADEEALQVLVVRSREELAPEAEFTLPDGVNAFRVYHAPDGTLALLDGASSLIPVCAYPPELADR